jgi:hypothetical protein
MARIEEADIERVKKATDLVALVWTPTSMRGK